MKRILLCLLIACSFITKAQVYNNEWIDYSKTYYKFKVGKTGLYRISQPVLVTAGLGSADAQEFQLWRNGVQVPIYTSVNSGNLSSSDYIEFWGEMNDGKPDKELYRNPDYQLNDKWSLESDTAVYFLTVNMPGSNLRLTPTPNNVGANTLSPEPYFMHTIGSYFRDRINTGYAVHVDVQYLYSSSYDKGEGWSLNDISWTTHSVTFNDLQTYTAGPAASFNIGVSGNSISTRNYLVRINSDSITGGAVDFFNYAKASTTFSTSILSSNTANVEVQAIGERLVVHKYELTYPRKFSFGGSANFEFTLPANAAGNYLEISNFNFGASAPVLYDLTNGKRYVADISAAPVIKVVLQPSAVVRKLVLVSEEPGNISSINSFQQRVFNNFSNASNQGNYLIISNSALFNGANGNPVEDYRAYRSSAAGGAFNAKIYLADELIDQFGFGIKQNPVGIRNFIRYARRTFGITPNHVFLIGKGVEYTTQRYYESDPNSDKLNMVPTMGVPASDNLLAAEPGSSIPEIPIGRLSVIYPKEITDYLNKVKENEQMQSALSPNIEDRAWMKNVVHLNGGGDPVLTNIITSSFNDYKKIISDTLFGANVLTFTKESVGPVEPVKSNFKDIFEKGTSLITYFGHSSSGVLGYSIDEPENYNNKGKYPSFLALGCSAGNFFGLSATRFSKLESISEKYVLAPERGMINFVASTHFGIVHYLKMWNDRMYKNIATTAYGKSIGEAIRLTAVDVFNFTSQEDFYSRSNIEQLSLHGDPAVKINPHAKADYVITDPLVKLNPSFISVAEQYFQVNAEFYNIGKAENKKIVIEIKREYPDQSTKIVYRDTISGIRYSYSLSANIPINPTLDKGANKITITVDADNNVDEFYESNNVVVKEFLIYEDEARPIYPYNFAIVNENSKLSFSTANPLGDSKEYKLEIDTTEFFNSPFKISKTVSTKGGVETVDPGFSFVNNTVYYWRVGLLATGGEYKWNTSSFLYLQNHEVGFNQSHAFQHFKSSTERIYLDSASRLWKYEPKPFATSLLIRMGTYPHTSLSDQAISVNGNSYIRSACWANSIIFNVFDAASNLPWANQNLIGGSYPSSTGLGLYESNANSCGGGREYNFEFPYYDTAGRRKMMDFMTKVIPDGAYVVIRSNNVEDYWGLPQIWAQEWANDTAFYGTGKSLYHYLKNAGFNDLDSFNRHRQWGFVFKKNDPTFIPKWTFTANSFDILTLSADIFGTEIDGDISSPTFGPAKKWKQLLWDGSSLETPTGDNPKIDIIGITDSNSETTLYTDIDLNQKSVDVSSIDAKQYPNLKLRMHNIDNTKYSPYQLGYWRLTCDLLPEGAIAPNIFIKMSDTIQSGQPLDFKIAFKNVTPWAFDSSIKVKMIITDPNNVQHDTVLTFKPLPGFDTLHVSYMINNTKQYVGQNNLYVEVNPDNHQPEQYHLNNFAYTKFFVTTDSLSPLLDVTFDNVHILNNDLVSSSPEIIIKLQDESKWLLLNDTSLVRLQIRYPNGMLKNISFNSDTLRFIAPQSGTDNTATINFKPYFTDDGSYELIVSGKDQTGNEAGNIQYKVAFQVINKPMISNMLNYPNPFTTSTAFVFTLTGSEVPQNLKIQILTITGKIVKEITKNELGPLRIGRNITEYKWDGTDQYGQKLGNGIYLYRVVTNLNGKSLDKYTSETDQTDKYFNKGYGKMYLMR